MLERILLADSGTGHSEEMLRFLMDIPSIQRASVTLLHVIPSQLSAEVADERVWKGQQILDQAAQSLHLEAPHHLTTMLRQGDPKDVVCKVADEINADLVIMGSRGLERMVSILENSVSQYVFQTSSHPILLVRDDLYVRRIKRVTVALDKSEAAANSLSLAIFLLRGVKGGKLNLVHVDPGRTGEANQVIGHAAEKDPVLAQAIARIKKEEIAYQCISAAGKPAREICRIADETHTDLLLLGSPDRRPAIARMIPDLDRLFGGSLSDYVRLHANCPVLLSRVVA